MRGFIDRHGVGRWLVNFCLILALFAVGVWLHSTVGSEATTRCRNEQVNRLALRGIILRGRDVGEPGTPGYTYYKKHPREAKEAIARTDEALADLPPIICP